MNLRALSPRIDPEQSRKQAKDLLEAFNAELASLIGSDEHWALVEPFGFGPDMAPDMTAAELCQS